MFTDKLEYLKHMVGDENVDNVNLKFALGRTEEIILNYTNNNQVPREVFYTHIDMALLYYNYIMALRNGPVTGAGEAGRGNISSIQEGDTIVAFGNNSDLETSVDKHMSKKMFEDKLLNDFRVPLRRVRKMRW